MWLPGFANDAVQIDYLVLCWAVHRLNGVVLPIHSTSSLGEIISHMQRARCAAIFTCRTMLSTSLEAAEQLAIPRSRIYTIRLGDEEGTAQDPLPVSAAGVSGQFTDLELLVTEGAQLPPLESLAWRPGQGKHQVAFLCATSGTSGKQVRTSGWAVTLRDPRAPRSDR